MECTGFLVQFSPSRMIVSSRHRPISIVWMCLLQSATMLFSTICLHDCFDSKSLVSASLSLLLLHFWKYFATQWCKKCKKMVPQTPNTVPQQHCVRLSTFTSHPKYHFINLSRAKAPSPNDPPPHWWNTHQSRAVHIKDLVHPKSLSAELSHSSFFKIETHRRL